jgi:hypothetical protein
LLVEVSNETSTYYSEPQIARVLYQTAIRKAETMPELSWAGKAALRHLDVLLATPTAKTAKALAKFWDVEGSYGPSNDPFPEKKAGKRKC